jgi:hypothetical protein
VTYGDAEFTAALQRYADEDHARQPNCSWCGKPGEPYEHHGIRFDGLVANRGERLCPACCDLAMAETPLLVRFCRDGCDPGRVYDLNPNTATEETEPPVTAIAAAYRYRDWPPPGRRRGRT